MLKGFDLISLLSGFKDGKLKVNLSQGAFPEAALIQSDLSFEEVLLSLISDLNSQGQLSEDVRQAVVQKAKHYLDDINSRKFVHLSKDIEKDLPFLDNLLKAFASIPEEKRHDIVQKILGNEGVKFLHKVEGEIENLGLDSLKDFVELPEENKKQVLERILKDLPESPELLNNLFQKLTPLLNTQSQKPPEDIELARAFKDEKESVSRTIETPEATKTAQIIKEKMPVKPPLPELKENVNFTPKTFEGSSNLKDPTLQQPISREIPQEKILTSSGQNQDAPKAMETTQSQDQNEGKVQKNLLENKDIKPSSESLETQGYKKKAEGSEPKESIQLNPLKPAKKQNQEKVSIPDVRDADETFKDPQKPTRFETKYVPKDSYPDVSKSIESSPIHKRGQPEQTRQINSENIVTYEDTEEVVSKKFTPQVQQSKGSYEIQKSKETAIPLEKQEIREVVTSSEHGNKENRGENQRILNLPENVSSSFKREETGEFESLTLRRKDSLPQETYPQPKAKEINLRIESAFFRFKIERSTLGVEVKLREPIENKLSFLDAQALSKSLQNLGLTLEALKVNGVEIFTKTGKNAGGIKKEERERERDREDKREDFSLLLRA